MKRFAPLLMLLVSAVALAAPVPKAKPKLEEVFGEIADPKGECKFEMQQGDALQITVPTTHPPRDPITASINPPLLGKVVEGDFVVIAKVTVGVPKTAGKTGKVISPVAFVGVALVSADDPKTGANIGMVLRRPGDDWTGEWLECHRRKGSGGATESGRGLEPDAAVYARVTRRGDKMTAEMSADGAKWKAFSSFQLTGATGPMTVGPTAFGCIDKEFTATISQYEIKPLKEEKK